MEARAERASVASLLEKLGRLSAGDLQRVTQAASSSKARSGGPIVKNVNTGVAATTRDADAASSLKLTSFFATKF